MCSTPDSSSLGLVIGLPVISSTVSGPQNHPLSGRPTDVHTGMAAQCMQIGDQHKKNRFSFLYIFLEYMAPVAQTDKWNMKIAIDSFTE